MILKLISFYRKRLSGLKRSPCCRFYPTCSAYAYRAVSEWGAFSGVLLSVYRLLRCQPLCKGGLDPVPRRRRKTVPKSFGGLSPDRYKRLYGGFVPFYTFDQNYDIN